MQNIKDKISIFFDKSYEAKGNLVNKIELFEILPSNINIVKNKCGIDLTGYKHFLDNSSIRHIIKQHSNPVKEKERGQIIITKADILNIPEILINPDDIEIGSKTKKDVETILFKKNINGEIYYYQEIRTGRKELMSLTMYKKDSGMPRATST